MKIRIADLNIELLGAEYGYIKERVKAYLADFKIADLTFNCLVTKEDILIPSSESTERIGKWNWIVNDDGSVTIFNFNTAYKKVSCLVNWNPDFKWADICVYDSCPLTGYSTENKLFNILGIVLWYNIIKFNGVVFHSSAISYKGDAILFSAPSGTGKSTHTALWKDAYPEDVIAINDDTPIIRIMQDGIFAYGTPWSGKSAINTPLKVPLKAIVCLKQGIDNVAVRMKGKEAFFRLFNETGKPAEKNLLNTMVDIITDISANVSIYELSCNISKDAVEVIKNKIYSE